VTIKKKTTGKPTYTLQDVYNSFSKHFPAVRITKMNRLDTQHIMAKLKEPIINCCTAPKTYYEVVAAFSKDFTKMVFIVGGAVRDYIRTKDTSKINDIDIKYTIDPKTIKSVVIKPLHVTEWNTNKKYKLFFRIGLDTKENSNLDANYVQPRKLIPTMLESKMNSLMWLVGKNTLHLIDLFGGEATQQAVAKIWDAPTLDYPTWFKRKEETGMLWRLLKFELRGYTVPIATKRALYTHYIQHLKRLGAYNFEKICKNIKPTQFKKVYKLIQRDCKEVGLPAEDLLAILNKNKQF